MLRRSRSKTARLLVVSLIVFCARSAWAQTWTTTSPGNLLQGSNWSGGTAPNSSGAMATISTNPTNAGDFTLSGTMTLGTLSYSNSRARSITGGALYFDTSSGTPQISNSGAALTIASTLDGTSVDGIDINGTGNVILSGLNTFTGPIAATGAHTISGNTIAPGGQASAFGAGTLLTIRQGATLQYTGATASTDRNVFLGFGGGTIDVTNSATVLTVSGAVTDNGNRSLAKVGAGTLVLSGANSYTGSTTVSAGQRFCAWGSPRLKTSCTDSGQK